VSDDDHVPPRPRDRRALARLFGVWIPTLSVVLTALSSDVVTPRSVLTGIAFGELIGAITFACVETVELVGRRIAAARGLRPRHPSRLRSYALAALCVPIGLLVADALVAQAATWLGFAWQRTDVTGMGKSVVMSLAMLGTYFATLLASDVQLAKKEAQMHRQAAELAAQRADNERLAGQLDTLTAQMYPHFLFNALNAVAATIPERPGVAEDLVVSLAELYGGALRAAKGAVHTLDDELALCRAYVALEQARFGDALQVTWAIDADVPSAELRVPTLLLQTLLENAVRHGFRGAPKDAHLALAARRDGAAVVIDVTDDGVGPAAAAEAPAPPGATRPVGGLGLANGRERLRLQFGAAASLTLVAAEPRGTRVSVRIPLAAAGGSP
jgi:hypothetical protein